MNTDKLIKEIFDGTFDPNTSYFDITEEQRDDIAKKFILVNREVFQGDKIKLYFDYFEWVKDKAIEQELYETADLYDRVIKKLFQETIDI
jgi:hypothetical protein